MTRTKPSTKAPRSRGKGARSKAKTQGRAAAAESSPDAARAYLLARGLDVSPVDLDRLVAAAAATLPRALYPVDPATDLTESDREALLRGGFELTPAPRGAAAPLVRTVAEFAAVLQRSKTVNELASLLGVNASRIRQRLNASPPTLYGFKVDGEWRIPDFLLEGDALIPGVDELAARLDRTLHPVALFRWLTTPNPDLVAPDAPDDALSPRAWLLSGHSPDVVAQLAADV